MNHQFSLNDIMGANFGKTKEDLAIEETMDSNEELDECPYNNCDGSGMIRIAKEDGAQSVEFCQCYQDRVFSQKLKNANISQDFLGIDFSFDDGKTKASILIPKLKEDEFKSKKKGQSLQQALLEEDPNDFIKRNYKTKVDPRLTGEIFESFSQKNLELLNLKKKTANLLLFGEPGNGKTTFACLIGRYFLQHDKKVYYTTTQNLLNQIMDKQFKTETLAKKYDVLILDKFFNEYHTDSQFAKKKINEILEIRNEHKLMTICTSTGTPKDFSLLYGKEIMSLLKGTFFFFHLEREGDGRVEKMLDMFDQFGF